MNDRLATQVTSSSGRMVEFLLSLDAAKLPTEVVDAARMRLVDTVGCGLYGSTMPWAQIAAQVVYEEGSQGRATIYGRRDAAAPARAALVNGTASHGIELDDIAPPGSSHPGAVVVPAVLAIAEQFELSGERVLLGVIAGYEVTSRISAGIGKKVHLGFHMPAIAGAIGATVGCGVALKLTHVELMRAIGVVCSFAAGLRTFIQGSGGMIKRMHAGRAAESGVLACLLARRGFTAPLAALDGKFGLLEVFGAGHGDPSALDRNLGDPFAVSGVWTKVYPFCGGMHSMANALETLRARHGIDARSVKAVNLGVNQRAMAVHTEVAPRDTMAAQYSMPFVAALALAGDAREPRNLIGETLNDPVVCELARKVALHHDPAMENQGYPRISGACVEVTMNDGRKFEETRTDAHGMPTDPCSEDEVKDKFRRLATAAISDRAAAEVAELLGRIETLPSIAPLSAALRAAIRS
jgi:2-methylcitrate dehydratase PrpD